MAFAFQEESNKSLFNIIVAILIVVAVVLETTKQLESFLVMSDYDNYLIRKTK